MTAPDTDRLARLGKSAHDHANCQLCDYLEARLAEAENTAETWKREARRVGEVALEQMDKVAALERKLRSYRECNKTPRS